MAKKIGLFKKIIKGVLIGGGTVLSLLSPPLGGAVVTAGMQIGAGAVAAGELIKTPESKGSLDTVTDTVKKTMTNLGLMAPGSTPTLTGGQKTFIGNPVYWVVGLALFLLLIFNFRRK